LPRRQAPTICSATRQDTWRSFDHLVDAQTGLPADNASPDGTKATYTSPTNIAAYLWSTVAARDRT
jgi:hypothetical protein